MLITVATETEDPSMAKSCTGYIITYMGCPIVWASCLQTVFALSTAEAEYIALSTVLRDVVPMMDLLTEMKEMGYDVQDKPTMHCKLFEDNSGTLIHTSGQVQAAHAAH
jgi:hypothetical protein